MANFSAELDLASPSFFETTQVSVGEIFSLAPAVTVVVTSSLTYRFRGFYVSGSTFEVWFGSRIPTANPSGHALIDITTEALV